MLSQQTARHGATVEFLGITGEGYRITTSGEASTAKIRFTYPIAAKVGLILVDVAGQSGLKSAKISHDKAGSTYIRKHVSGGKEECQIDFSLDDWPVAELGLKDSLETTSSVTLTFGIAPICEVEFVAEPRARSAAKRP